MSETPRTLLDPARLNCLRMLVEMTAGLPGCNVEAGCYQGGSGAWIAKHSYKHTYLCDTFNGLPESCWLPDEFHKPGEFACDQDQVQSFIESQGLQHRVTLIKGVFPQSLSDFYTPKIAFAHLDLDFEASTYNALSRVYQNLVPGGIVVLDDYAWPHCPGVERAAKRFLGYHPGEMSLVRTVENQAMIVKHRA